MKVETGNNEGAYLGARWYALSNVHIFTVLTWTVTDEKNISEHLYDAAWEKICEVYENLNRDEYIPEIKAAYEVIDIMFYHKEQFESERARVDKNTRPVI